MAAMLIVTLNPGSDQPPSPLERTVASETHAGETRDTAELPYVATMMTDAAIPRNERVRLFRTWGAGVGMLPVGGPDIWGNTTWAPDDTEDMRDTNATYG